MATKFVQVAPAQRSTENPVSLLAPSVHDKLI